MIKCYNTLNNATVMYRYITPCVIYIYIRYIALI